MLRNPNPHKTLEQLYFESKSVQRKLHELDQEIAMLESVKNNWNDCLRETSDFLKEQAPKMIHEREIKQELKNRLYIEMPIMREFLDDLRAKNEHIQWCGYDRYRYNEKLTKEDV